VSPPDSMLTSLPCTCVLRWITSSPSDLPRARLALAVNPIDAPPEPTLMATPTAALLEEFALFCTTRSCDEVSDTSPSALSARRCAAARSEPCTLRLLSLPAPCAVSRMSPPAVTSLPWFVVVVVSVRLLDWLEPTVMLTDSPPAAFGSACSACAASLALIAVAATPSACMRASPTLPTFSAMSFVLCSALSSGALTATVRPLWRKAVVCTSLPCCAAPWIEIFCASTSTSPLGVWITEPVCANSRPATTFTSPLTLPTVAPTTVWLSA